MKKALLIDFNDSFTWNLVQELEEVGFKVTVLEWTDFEELTDHDLLVFGAGPGHPDDYQRLFPLIREWLSLKRAFFGVCLGHQIFWRIQGEQVVRSKDPRHGQKTKLELDPSWRSWLGVEDEVWVQRYNSLAVMAQGIRHPGYENLIQNEELLITRGPGILTYQFHPESVGTTYRHAFFRPLLRDLV